MSAGLISGVQTSRGWFACDALVNAAGAWSARIARFANLELPVYPIRGQILCTDTLKKTLRCNISTSQCYLLQKAHGEVIVGSTTEHSQFDTSVPIESLQKLAAGALRAIPGLRSVGVKRSWSGLRPGTPDEFPILGSIPEIENYFNATGGFRTGIVATPLSAEIVAAQVLGEPPPFAAEPFLASRFDGSSTGDA
jgi:hydrogen cyanide synthase HcnC